MTYTPPQRCLRSGNQAKSMEREERLAFKTIAELRRSTRSSSESCESSARNKI